MTISQVMQHENMDFKGMEESYFLLGLLSAFDNRFQATADKMMKEISWKQFFAVICISICKEEPTIKELAEIMGSSHQNVKQILLKLEKKGFVQIMADPNDKRKQRVGLTLKCKEFCEGNDELSTQAITAMFEGISREQLHITIQTIMIMEENLKKM